jgi:PiT family inorganic phosphate transporter
MSGALMGAFLAACVAWANGANDISKGVATLIGSGLSSYRRGLAWGTAWTAGGAAAAWALSSSLLQTFSTALVVGVFPDLTLLPISVAAGAFAWVLIASRTGLPISTTHALAGAIVGSAISAGGVQGVHWQLLLSTVAVPLVVSPVLAGGLSYLVDSAASRRLAYAARICVCVADRPLMVSSETFNSAATTSRAVSIPLVIVDEERSCAESAVSGLQITDAAHWMTSAALSFARGLNDTPKIVALGAVAVTAAGASEAWLFAVCACAMSAGSLLTGTRVTRTLAETITTIDPLKGLVVSGVSAMLVLFASVFALPVSTTHVVSGAIVGVGLRAGAAGIRWDTVSSVVCAWLITVPVSGSIAAITYQIVR